MTSRARVGVSWASAEPTCSNASRVAVTRSFCRLSGMFSATTSFSHAVENQLPLPIGTADAGMLDTHSFDEDVDAAIGDIFEDDDDERTDTTAVSSLRTEADFRKRAGEIYALYAGRYKRRFRLA